MPLALLTMIAPSGPRGGETQAGRAFTAGEYARAAALLRSAIDRDPRDATLHHQLARCQYELRQYEEAARSEEEAVALDPGRSEYHQWLGRALGGQAERAGWFTAFRLARRVRAEFEEAVRLDPGNVRAQRDLIEFYRQAPGIVGGGQAKAWRQAGALGAVDVVQAGLARAELWRGEGKLDRAETEYRLVLAARPNRAGPCLEVADFYLARGDGPRMTEAVAAAAVAEGSEPQLPYYSGVAAFLTGGRDEEAEHLLRAYLETASLSSEFPSVASAREWLGRVYERRGQPGEAVREYRAALVLEPNRKGAREALRRLNRD
jgi:tetratricopeptide (TPR) repeat protein